MIDLLLLGTGAMTPLPERWLSSLLMRCRGEMILFDCGEGTQIPWRRYGWGFRRLGAICLSHCHADHIAGLPGVLHTLANAGRTELVDCYGPQGTGRIVDGLREIARDLPFPFVVHDLGGGEFFDLPGGLRGTVLPVEHRIPCLAYRIEAARTRRFDPERAQALDVPLHLWRDLQRGDGVAWTGGTAVPDDVLGSPRRGLSVGFVTDTRPTETLPDFLRGVDLLVCEGTYGDPADQAKAIAHKHMTFTESATLARDAGAGELLLTHFSPALEDPAAYEQHATAIFPRTIIGQSGFAQALHFGDEPED